MWIVCVDKCSEGAIILELITEFAILKIPNFLFKTDIFVRMQVYSISELDGFRAASGVVTNVGNIPPTAIVLESDVVIGDFERFGNAFGLLPTGGEGQPDGVAASPRGYENVIGGQIGVFNDSFLKTLYLNDQTCVA